MTTSRLSPATQTETAADLSRFWHNLRNSSAASKPAPPPQSSVMEIGLHVLSELSTAPPRTIHNAPLVKSSPLSPPVRAMLETREFGRRFDAASLDLSSAEKQLPSLDVPEGDVRFLASDRSLEDLSLSVDGLLQFRKRLLAPTIDPNLPRRRVLVLGAGPAGLIAAVQLSLRGHDVIVCEAREVYARNRYIGVYKEVTHLMAALGMPESMTYDFSQYRGKRGIMVADIQTFLHGVALKLGAVIYMGAVARSLDLLTLRVGEVTLQKVSGASSQSHSPVGVIRWQHDMVTRVSSGVAIQFDTIVEATGGRSGLREVLVGTENVVSIRDIGISAAKTKTSLDSFFDDPEDHCAEYVESDYGCPPGLRSAFASALLSGDKDTIPDEIPCFVSNIDASIFKEPMHETEGSHGLASRIGDRTLEIPHDWVVLECRVSDQRLSRYHIEGPLPQSFDFGGKHTVTSAVLDKLNPVSLLLRILYAMGVPFHAVDRRQLVNFYAAESSQTDASDIVGTWIGRFRGLRVEGETPIWRGTVPGSDAIEYGIIGESLQNAWYRFGVGVDDSVTAATNFASGFELAPEPRLAQALRLQRTMQSRAVQILYHLFAVARNKDQGVVGSVLTDYQMEEQHAENLAEARLRQIAQEGADMLAAELDLRRSGADPLLESALDFVRASCCRRAIELLKCFRYPCEQLSQGAKIISDGRPDWAARARKYVFDVVSLDHRAILTPLFARDQPPYEFGIDETIRQERLIELAAGRYRWVSPWLRACALRALDPSAPNAATTMRDATHDPERLVAEIARTIIDPRKNDNGRRSAAAGLPTIDRVLILKKVSIFAEIPHELLADVAPLLTERLADPHERIIEKGEHGDALYIIASGRVLVHDGDRELRCMQANEFFGELSLLDSEPRAASVTALEPSFLFRLEQDDFYALTRERPEITHALNRALCRLIRGT
jgi:CRP/FNR family cyclic AMP-dependent transcriptional regulator